MTTKPARYAVEYAALELASLAHALGSGDKNVSALRLVDLRERLKEIEAHLNPEDVHAYQAMADKAKARQARKGEAA